jgi:hemerythrin-like domain-containing protein
MIQIGAPAATIDSPIEHLVACHRRIEQRLDTLVNAAGHLQDQRSAALAAITSSFSFLDTSGVLHTEDEEASLFPRLRQKLSAAEIEFVDSLEAQHVQAEEIYSRLKQLASQLSAQDDVDSRRVAEYVECAEALRTLYRAHIRTEDEVLTALAKRSLSEPELIDISREMRERRTSRSSIAVS